MRNILIPTDFSTAAWNATKYALQLLAESKCVFHFLNAYTPELYSNRLMAGRIAETSKTCSAQLASEKGLQKTIKRIKKEYNNPLHTYKSISTFSMLIDEVREVVEQQHIDFVVMSASGAADDDSIFLGRNTVRILNNVDKCPVLVIPAAVQFTYLQHISLVSEHNHLFNNDELNPVAKLAKEFNCSVEIASLQNAISPRSDLQQLNHVTIGSSLRNIVHKIQALNMDTTLTTTLKKYVDQTNCQLIVLPNGANSYLRNLCNDFIVGKSTFCCNLPMLSLQLSENNISVSQ